MAVCRNNSASGPVNVENNKSTLSTITSKRDSKDHTCSVCLELFKGPKLLPCCHAFCLECLEKAVRKKGEITCPQCRKTHKIPVEGLTALLTDFIATYEVEVAGLKQGGMPQICGECEQSGPIRYYCGDCQNYLCGECGLQLHIRLKAYRGHKVIPIEEINAATLQSYQIQYCSVHKGEALKLYCETCSELICRDCTLVKHRVHDFKFVQDARKEVNTKMVSLGSEVAKKRGVFKGHLQEIKKVAGAMTSHVEVLKADINTFFDNLARSIERRRKALLQEAEADHQKDLKQVLADKSFHEMTITQISSVVGLVRKAQRCTNDSEMVLTALHSINLLKELEWDCRAFTKVVLSTPKFTAGTNVAVDAIGKVKSAEAQLTTIELLSPPKQVSVGETASFKVKVSNSLFDERSGEPVHLQQILPTDFKAVVHYGQHTKQLDNSKVQVTKEHPRSGVSSETIHIIVKLVRP